MVIGEPLSKFMPHPERVIYYSGTQRYYANEGMLRQQPLDFGMVIYYLLWSKFKDEPPITKLEAYHDHRRRLVRACVWYTSTNPQTDISGLITYKITRHVLFNEREASAPDHVNKLIQTRIDSLYHEYLKDLA